MELPRPCDGVHLKTAAGICPWLAPVKKPTLWDYVIGKLKLCSDVTGSWGFPMPSRHLLSPASGACLLGLPWDCAWTEPDTWCFQSETILGSTCSQRRGGQCFTPAADPSRDCFCLGCVRPFSADQFQVRVVSDQQPPPAGHSCPREGRLHVRAWPGHMGWGESSFQIKNARQT